MSLGVYGHGAPLAAPLPPPVHHAVPSTAFAPTMPVMQGDTFGVRGLAQPNGYQAMTNPAHLDPNSFWPVGIALASPVLALMGGAAGMVMGTLAGAGGAGLAWGVAIGGSALGLLVTGGILSHIVFGDLLKGQLPSGSDIRLALTCALPAGLTCLGVGLGFAMGAPWLAGFMGLFGSALTHLGYGAPRP